MRRARSRTARAAWSSGWCGTQPLLLASCYVECTLAKPHGIRFGPHDWIEDKKFAKRSEVEDATRRLQRFDEEHIASPEFARLDAYPITARSGL